MAVVHPALDHHLGMEAKMLSNWMILETMLTIQKVHLTIV
jgi:hypothetical protein